MKKPVVQRKLKLGKTPARPGAVKFKLARYLIKTELPKPPPVFEVEPPQQGERKVARPARAPSASLISTDQKNPLGRIPLHPGSPGDRS